MKTKAKIERYNPKEIEEKWRKIWKEENLYKFDREKVEEDIESKTKEKFYTLVELPYPSGDLHIGHWFTFIAPDVLSRFKKMQGYDVFFPMGFDAFGLPAENAAIKRGIHPQDWTMKNIETMTSQFQTMGTMIDWSRVTITCLPEYYKWNQWIFLKMYEKGLAYRSKMLSNWCPVDQTVLANEHVENGHCWRCGALVEQKEVEQWFLKITDYAEKLLWKGKGESGKGKDEIIRSQNDKTENINALPLTLDLNQLDWPNSVKAAQNEWIGKKEGIEITYDIVDSPEKITVFTTRPDTNFGATFIAIAPEHPLVKKITTEDQKEKVEKYLKETSEKTELERQEEEKEKTGVFTGSYALNPLTNFKMPIWISDFVLINFGTGALVGVPGHDKRDFDFASKFGLDIKRVVVGNDKDESPITKKDQVQEESGVMINSDFLNGMNVHDANSKIMDYFEEKGWGKRVINYHLHDWSISRQRYWGTPVPMIHCEKCGIVPVPVDHLPVTLPYNVDFTPKGKAPLASNEEWLATKCPKCQGSATRDPETLDTFFDSSWYYYRYLDPKNEKEAFSKQDVDDLMPVNIYFGGSEHTVGHTLYARFFTKFFHDLGLVPFSEFADSRVQHGIVLGPDGNKMSKSKGNVINPDDVVSEFGTDSVRLYLSFMMPYNSTGPWDTSAMYGVYRFLKRVWDLQYRIKNHELRINESVTREEGDSTLRSEPSGSDSKRIPSNAEIETSRVIWEGNSRQEPQDINLNRNDLYEMHTAIKKVTEDIKKISNNTAVAHLMKWINYLEAKNEVSLEEYKTFLLLLSPFAVYMTEEIWSNLKANSMDKTDKNWSSIHNKSWPKFSSQYLIKDEIEIAVQVNGKLRGNIMVSNTDLKDQEKVETAARTDEKISKWIEKGVKKVIYIPGKILNFVV